MIRSETRGVARGAMPKRSRSARGPPVCIISIAQQASPNIMYQTDVEDHEHERDEIEADVEVDPGGAAGRLAALVGGELVAARVGGAQQDAEPQHQPAQHEGEREEDEDVGELEVHRTSSGYPPPSHPVNGRAGPVSRFSPAR